MVLGVDTYRALLLSSSQPLDCPGLGWALLAHWGRATQNHKPTSARPRRRKKKRKRDCQEIKKGSGQKETDSSLLTAKRRGSRAETKRSFRAPKTIRITLETKSYKNSPRNCLKFDLNKKIHAFSQNILGRTPSDNRILLCGIIKKCRQEVAQTKKQTRTRAPCVPSKDLPLFTDRFTKSTSCGFFFFSPPSLLPSLNHACFYFCDLFITLPLLYTFIL